jgi:hypothetical protein
MSRAGTAADIRGTTIARVRPCRRRRVGGRSRTVDKPVAGMKTAATEERGQALVMLAVVLPVLIGFLALGSTSEAGI